MNKENQAVPQNEEISNVIESHALIEEYSGKLKLGLLKLHHLYKEISEHLAHGDTTDQQQNSKLWHDLNNIAHQIKQITHYTEHSVKDVSVASEKLIENLHSLRPPKPTE